MDKELVQLKALLDDATVERRNNKDFILGSIDGKDVVLQKCGIGKVNSAVGAVELIDNYAPDVVISTGVAGGADDRMSVGDVVIGSEYCYHDAYCGDECAFGQIMGMPESFAAPAGLVGKAVSAWYALPRKDPAPDQRALWETKVAWWKPWGQRRRAARGAPAFREALRLPPPPRDVVFSCVAIGQPSELLRELAGLGRGEYVERLSGHRRAKE